MPYVTVATWDHAPHLTDEAKAAYLSKVPEAERAIRTKGMPSMGGGLIYRTPKENIMVADFVIPPHFLWCYAFDTGWKWNACVWMAWDKQNDIVYIPHVYKRAYAEPPINAAAIQAKGKWIPGVADAADTNRLNGQQYIKLYQDMGLDIELPNKAISAGIQQVWTRLTTGRLKVFASCGFWFDEYLTYSRNSKGVIFEQDDHLMDCTRYGIVSGLDRAKLKPKDREVEYDSDYRGFHGPYGWMA